MALNTAESLAEKQRGIKVGSRVCALQSGKYTLERGTVTADEGMSWRIKFDRYDEISVPKSKVVRVDNSAARNAKFKVTDEVIYRGKHYLVHEVNGNKVKISDWEGDERTVSVNDPNLKALNSCARNAEFKVGDKVKYWVFDKKVTGTIKAIRGDKAEVVAVGDKTGITYPIKDLVAANSVCSRNAVVAKALNACGTARNASGHKVKVTIKSITDKGIQTFEKIVDVDDLESWMRSAGLGGEYQHVMKQLTAMGVNEVSLSAMSKVMIADV